MKKSIEPVENPEQIEYREAAKDLKDAELRMVLRGRGIDPYDISQKDFDEIKRRINALQQIDTLTKNKMNEIQQAGNKEQGVISQEIEAIIAKLFQEQHPPLLVPELPLAAADQKEPAGNVEISGEEQVDKEIQVG